jgi:RNA polymerase sigma-70 factor (ECF subfamily)
VRFVLSLYFDPCRRIVVFDLPISLKQIILIWPDELSPRQASELLSAPAAFTMVYEFIFPPLRAEELIARFRTFLPMPAIQSPVTEEIHPDVALVARAKEGDTAAFEQLVRQYERQIFRVAQHITQNREDAEDITQDAFLKAYEKLDQFQGNSKFSTWLVRIAVNESLMRLRKRKTSKTVSMDEDVHTEDGSIPRDFAEWRPNPEQQYNQAELGDILRKTIQGLPPGFRTVFTLRDIENLSTEETAEALGLSVPAVKSRLLRARLQLRERLSRYFRQKQEGQTA